MRNKTCFCNSLLTLCNGYDYSKHPPAAQMELLKLYSAGVPEEYLTEIKEMIARFLLSKAREAAGKSWQEKDYSDKTAEKWIKGE